MKMSALKNLFIWPVLVITGFFSLLPLIWLLLSAFVPENSLALLKPNLKFLPTLENFSGLVQASGRSTGTIQVSRIWIWFFNSIILAVGGTFLHLIIDSMAAYAFARRSFPGRNLLFGLIVGSLMLPQMVTLVPLYLLLIRLGINNHLAGVLLPGLADAIGIFLLTQFMRTLPIDMEDAARLDGISEWRLYTQIIIPLSVPGLTALTIFSFQGIWNQFVLPLIVLQRSQSFTLPVGLSYLSQTEFGFHYGWIMAGAFIMILPVFMVFFLFQKNLDKGLRIYSIHPS